MVLHLVAYDTVAVSDRNVASMMSKLLVRGHLQTGFVVDRGSV